MIRREKHVQNCVCISSTPVNTFLTTIRMGILSLDTEFMWEIRKSGNSQKNIKAISLNENTTLKLSEHAGTKITKAVC